jgi:hypothetical protein
MSQHKSGLKNTYLTRVGEKGNMPSREVSFADDNGQTSGGKGLLNKL